jgi:hypothetical protein
MKLICSKPVIGYTTKGKSYKIVKVHTNHNMLSVISNDGNEYMYSANRFITLEQWKDNFKAMLFARKFIVI